MSITSISGKPTFLTGSIGSFTGLRLVVSEHLPCYPSDGENARRIVRHGLSDVLKWVGEEVGMAPFEPTHMLQSRDILFVSPQTYLKIKESYGE